MGAGDDLLVGDQVMERSFYFDLTHRCWVQKMVEADEAAYPSDVTLLNGVGVMFLSESRAALIDELLT
jgi:hypothetical protein